MADIGKFSERVVDLAERFADITDAAQGRGNRRGGRVRARWFMLPAAGAGLYALGASGSFTRQAKNAVIQAKELASDLPDDLLGRIQHVTGDSNGGTKDGRRSVQSARGRRQTSSRRTQRSTGQNGSQRRRKPRASSAN
jgi:hypothetical protein